MAGTGGGKVLEPGAAISRRSRQQRCPRSRGVRSGSYCHLAFERESNAPAVEHPHRRRRLERSRPFRRRSTRPRWIVSRSRGALERPGDARVSPSGRSSTRADGGRRSADQLVRHRRGSRGAIGAAGPKTDDCRGNRPRRVGHAHEHRCDAHRLAERRAPGRVRSSRRSTDRRAAAAQGIVPVDLCRRWERDAVRDGFSVAIAARVADQRAGYCRRHADRGLGEDPRRSARRARWRVRREDYSGAVGNPFRGSRSR